MPNKAVQAAGEAMPKTSMPQMTEAFARERIGILGHEISQLLDLVPGASMVGISPAGKRDSKEKVLVGFAANEEFFQEPVIEHPWTAVHRLTRELSVALTKCNDGSWVAHVLPAGGGNNELQMRKLPRLRGTGMPEIALDRVERLTWELSTALTEYADGTFQAMVLPSSVGGHTVMLAKISAWNGRASR
ncbi:hypothetical protein DEM27_28745 [Metarhizobium album]|uniref:Uncharacterized protein n=1 Tax=Metarhizobium album TaxID=2182425 RepID=A0A2U2DHJ5_9HYPH|nr:hypothetical protein [Rhizobium album]PWE52793.1 hypothetical protein DEM27_28745 [Rhizobium album]